MLCMNQICCGRARNIGRYLQSIHFTVDSWNYFIFPIDDDNNNVKLLLMILPIVLYPFPGSHSQVTCNSLGEAATRGWDLGWTTCLAWRAESGTGLSRLFATLSRR